MTAHLPPGIEGVATAIRTVLADGDPGRPTIGELEGWLATLDEATTERWSELRLSGQPPGGAPPYDFTARTAGPNAVDPGNGDTRWRQIASIAQLALGMRSGLDGAMNPWTDVTVQTRDVVATRWDAATDWVAMSDGEINDAAVRKGPADA